MNEITITGDNVQVHGLSVADSVYYARDTLEVTSAFSLITFDLNYSTDIDQGSRKGWAYYDDAIVADEVQGVFLAATGGYQDPSEWQPFNLLAAEEAGSDETPEYELEDGEIYISDPDDVLASEYDGTPGRTGASW